MYYMVSYNQAKRIAGNTLGRNAAIETDSILFTFKYLQVLSASDSNNVFGINPLSPA